jgi:23S rRNA (uracil1939-C5)-methyltransferase
MKELKILETVITMVTTDSQSNSSKVNAELEIEKIISNGYGLARYSGRAVFIPFTIPGEKIYAEIDLTGKQYLEGKILDIIKPSPDRVDPPCPLYGNCGGCSLQHISYERQLEIKKELVSEALRRNGGIKIDHPEIICSSPYSYRNRIQLHKSSAGSPGFKERKGSDVIPVNHCPVCNEGINSYLAEGAKELVERTVLFSPDDKRIYSSAEETDAISVYLNDIEVKTSASSFFQSNIKLFEKTLIEIKEHIKGSTLLDLYAGAAIFGTVLYESFNKIISVEENVSALKFGEKNIPDRTALKKAFYPVSVERFLKKEGKRIKPDTIIVDPPRTGLSKQVRKYLMSLNPERLIYLSCDYATLGRDLGELTRGKYSIDMIKIYDYYPQTAHAETLVVLKRKK